MCNYEVGRGGGVGLNDMRRCNTFLAKAKYYLQDGRGGGISSCCVTFLLRLPAFLLTLPFSSPQSPCLFPSFGSPPVAVSASSLSILFPSSSLTSCWEAYRSIERSTVTYELLLLVVSYSMYPTYHDEMKCAGLTHLTTLNLSINSLTGSFPDIGLGSSLRNLNLSCLIHFECWQCVYYPQFF